MLGVAEDFTSHAGRNLTFRSVGSVGLGGVIT